MRKKIYALLLGLSLPFLAIAGLETVTYISDLVITNPLSSDPAHQGDDHLRAIKTGIKNTFPNITGAVTATQTELNIIDGATITTAELNTLAGDKTSYKPAGTSRASNTTFSDDPDLTVALAANSVYSLDMFVLFTAHVTTGGFKYSFTVPATAAVNGRFSAVENCGTEFNFAFNETSQANVNVGCGTNSTVPAHFIGKIETGGTAGTFALRWAQVSSDPNATIVHSGSWIEVKKLN